MFAASVIVNIVILTNLSFGGIVRIVILVFTKLLQSLVVSPLFSFCTTSWYLQIRLWAGRFVLFFYLPKLRIIHFFR